MLAQNSYQATPQKNVVVSNKTTVGERLAELLFDIRFVFVVPIVLPASYAFSTMERWRDWVLFDILPMVVRQRGHDEKTKDISERVTKWKNSGSKNLLCTARPWWMQMTSKAVSYKHRGDNAIPMPLYNIISLDEAARTIRVEPFVTVGQITRFLVPKGYTLEVVPELDDLTPGGLLLGYGIETSSHVVGLFSDTVVSAEVLTGQGKLVQCSDEVNSDLFHALPWSLGSVGFVVSMDVKIVPVKPYARIVHESVGTFEEMTERFSALTMAENPHTFVEGLMFSPTHGVLSYGDFSTGPTVKGKPDGAVNVISRWYKPWWYKHVESIAPPRPVSSPAHGANGAVSNGHSNGHTNGTTNGAVAKAAARPDERGDILAAGQQNPVEYIPIRDYYHRHTRSIFWMTELILPFGNHPIFRWLLGWLLPLHIKLLKLIQPESLHRMHRDKIFTQDFLLPLSTMLDGLKFGHAAYGTYPVWICGHKLFTRSPQGLLRNPPTGLGASRVDEYMVDLGYYPTSHLVLRKDLDIVKATRAWEKWLRDNGGYQANYVTSYQTRDEFSKMFDLRLNALVRAKYGCEGVFMDVYSKFKGEVDGRASPSKRR